jgi:hypothetical protein
MQQRLHPHFVGLIQGFFQIPDVVVTVRKDSDFCHGGLREQFRLRMDEDKKVL